MVLITKYKADFKKKEIKVTYEDLDKRIVFFGKYAPEDKYFCDFANVLRDMGSTMEPGVNSVKEINFKNKTIVFTDHNRSVETKIFAGQKVDVPTVDAVSLLAYIETARSALATYIRNVGTTGI